MGGGTKKRTCHVPPSPLTGSQRVLRLRSYLASPQNAQHPKIHRSRTRPQKRFMIVMHYSHVFLDASASEGQGEDCEVHYYYFFGSGKEVSAPEPKEKKSKDKGGSTFVMKRLDGIL